MRVTHAGGIIRAVLLLAWPARSAAGQVAETPPPEWEGQRRRRRGWSWGSNDRRARLRRIARRRARKGYRFADGDRL